jgi:hypothetical protein
MQVAEEHKPHLVIPGQSFDMHSAHLLFCQGVESRPCSPLLRFFGGVALTSAKIEVPTITKAPSSWLTHYLSVMLADRDYDFIQKN